MPAPSAVAGPSSKPLDHELEVYTGRRNPAKLDSRTRTRAPARPDGLAIREGAVAAEPHTAMRRGLPAAHGELPAALERRQTELTAAADALRATPNPTEAALKTYDDAMQSYLNEVSTHLRQLSKAPNAAVTPSLQQYAGNVAGAFTNNALSFLIPTIMSVPFSEARHQTYMYSVALAFAAAPAGEAAAWVQRTLGGATPQLRMSYGGSANAGSYKAIAGDLLLAMTNLALYGLSSALLSQSSWMSGNANGQILRSLISGGVMSLAGQGVVSMGAKHTLQRNGVTDAKDLPETAHNRTIRDGIYLQADGPWMDRTTSAIKTQEVISKIIGGVLGAGVYGLIRGAGENIENKPGQNALTVFCGIGAYLLIAQVVRLVFTATAADPGKHANKFGIAASDVVSRQIRSSAFDRFENMLDAVGVGIRENLMSAGGVSRKAEYDDAMAVLSGAAFRGRAADQLDDHGKATAMESRMQAALDAFKEGAEPLTGTEHEIVRMLETVIESIGKTRESAAAGNPIQPDLQDIGNRIRDVEALVLQSVFQNNGLSGFVAQNPRVMKLVDTLMPTFAAVREGDRRAGAQAFVSNLTAYAEGHKSAEEVLMALAPDGHQRVLARDVADAINALPPGKDRTELPGIIDRMLNEAFKGKVPDRLASSMLVLRNQLNPVLVSNEPRVQAFMTRFASPEGATPDGARVIADQLKTAFSSGEFTPGDFLRVVQERQRQAPDGPVREDEEAAAGVGQQELMQRMRSALPRGFEETLAREFPIDADATLQHAADEMVSSLWRDQQAMPEVHRGLMAGAMSLRFSGELVDLAFPPQHDAHFHPTSYSGRINSLSQLVGYMDRNNIQITNLAGIPSQVYLPTPERKYYANSQHPIDYRDHDFPLAGQFQKLSDKDKDRFDLSITGFDVTNGPNISQAIKDRLREYPGVFKAVGEVTLKKEIISGKNPHNPIINGPATQELFNACAQAGLPLILHCDRSEPGSKDQYAQQVFAAIRQWVGRMEYKSNDVLATLPGAKDVPPIVPKIVWAHGAGISRFTAESKDHTQQLDTLLRSPELMATAADGTRKQVLSLDLSWDFIAHDILENVYDQLQTENLSKPIRDGIQNLLRLYKAFSEEGGRSDKADDLGDKTLAAMHRIGGRGIGREYMEAVANFKAVVEREMTDEPTRNAFLRLTEAHGDAGNNWLYMFRQHQDRLLFGTDALAVGIKAHGETAYALNTQVLTPMYHIFDALAAHVTVPADQPPLSGISTKIATSNYEGVFRDPDVKARRDAYEAMLLKEAPAEHSTNARPQPLVSQEDEGLRRTAGNSAAAAPATTDA